MCEVLLEAGRPAVIQGGNLQWLRIKYEEDDGVSDTHFAYMWTPHEVPSQMVRAIGGNPEMHVWVGLLDTQEIVDISTLYLPEEARKRGLDWPGERPPAYLWSQKLPHAVVYEANKDATFWALCRIINDFDPAYLHGMKDKLMPWAREWKFPFAGMESG